MKQKRGLDKKQDSESEAINIWLEFEAFKRNTIYEH